MKHIVCVAAASLLAAMSASAAEQETKWYRGSTHIHAANPYETYTPQRVANWYREHGYDFIVLTEHETILETRGLSSENRKFLVIPGQEITQLVSDASHSQGVRHTHVNGLGIRTAILPVEGKPDPPGTRRNQLTPDQYRKLATATSPKITPLQSYIRNIGEIRKQGGVPQINHPNINWSVRPQDLLDLEGPYLLEIANTYPFSNNRGGVAGDGTKVLSTEALWDALLSAGRVAWAVASDDAHDYTNFDLRDKPTPGKGWIVVRANELSEEAVKRSLLSGDFYASTGIELQDISTADRRITVQIKNLPQIVPHMIPDPSVQTTFVGQHGRVLKQVYGRSASYDIRGDEGYVRAVIVDSDGRLAWTQPVFLNDRIK